MINIKKVNKIYILTGFYLLFAISIFYTPLLYSGEGYAIISWDHVLPYNEENFYNRFFFMWNEHEQHSNLQFLTTFMVHLPFLLLSKYIFHLNPYSLTIILRMVFFVVGGVSSYFLIKWLIELSIKNGINIKILEISALIGSIIFVTSPVYVTKIQFYVISSVYQLLPLIFLLLFKYLYTKHLKYLVLLAIILPIVYSNFRFIFLVPLNIITFAVIYETLNKSNLKSKVKTISSLALFLIVSFLIFVYTIPYFLFTEYSVLAQVPPYDLGIENLLSVRDNAGLINTLSLRTFWLEDVYFYFDWNFWILNFSRELAKDFSLFITIIAIISIIFFEKLSEKRFFILCAINFLLLVFISSNLFDNILIWTYKWIDVFSTMFRDPRDVGMLLSVFRAILTGFSLHLILTSLSELEYIRNINVGLSATIVVTILISTIGSSYPIFNNFSNVMSPTKINDSYFEVNKFLGDKSSDDKIITYPKYRIKAKWNYNKDIYMFDDLFIKNKNILVWEGGTIQPSYTMIRRSPLTMYSNWIYWTDYYAYPLDVVHLNISQDMAILFSKIGVHYIIVNKNVSKIGYDIEKNLNIQKRIIKVYDAEDFSIYNITVASNNDLFGVASGILLLDDTLDSIDMLKIINNTNYPILLMDGTPLDYANNILNWNNSLIFSKYEISTEYKIRNILKSNNSNLIIIRPYTYAENVKPENGWAKAFTLYENYDKTLRNTRIFDYSQDHLYGVVYSIKEGAILKIPLNIYTGGNYSIYVRYFNSFRGGRIKINDVEVDTISTDNVYKWIEIPQHIYKNDKLILQNIRGFNSINSIVVVPENYSSQEIEIKGFNVNELYKKTNPIINSHDVKIVDIISYQKKDSTEYKVNVNAAQPFILVFTESYDPLWTAYVKDKEYNSIPLYSSINGFFIDSVGNLEITVKYKPQRWFIYSLIISLVILMMCLSYLFYEQRRSPEEKEI